MEEGLLAEAVACTDQQSFALVPDRECEHARQALDGGNTMLQVQREDHFGVGGRTEMVVGQLTPELAVAVDLAVERHRDVAVR
jgi:hypothetical protein